MENRSTMASTIQLPTKVMTDKSSDATNVLLKKPDTHDQNINNKEGNSRPKKNQFNFCSLVVFSIAMIIGVYMYQGHEKNTPEKNVAEIDKNYTLIPWTGGESSIPKCFSVHDEWYLKSNETGVFMITFLFQFSDTLDLHNFEVKVNQKRDNKSLLLGSSWKRAKGPTKMWLILTNINVHTNDLLYVESNSLRHMKNNHLIL